MNTTGTTIQTPPTALRATRLVASVAIVIAVFGNLARIASQGNLDLVNYFSYFTILSNVAAMVMFGWMGLTGRQAPALPRGAITLYMTITGVVDNILLSGVDVLTPPWVDLIVHNLGPIVVLADWILDPPPARVGGRTVTRWLAFPIVWLTYTLIRGAATDWYPYPFLDPADVGGYGGVALYVVAITAVFLVVGFGLAAIVNRRR